MKARQHPDGLIDLSQGTPVDSTPEFIQAGLRASANSPSYPVTAGSAKLRESLRRYATEILGIEGDFDVLPTIGSKELIAWLPTLLEVRSILIPSLAYPTYRVGGILARAQVSEVEIAADSWPLADLAWINSPSNPTGRVHSDNEIVAAITWSREHNRVLVSDECYLHFPDKKQGKSIITFAQGNNKNLLAVHSLSKRSNFAGYRGAFVVGDSELISKLLEVRKHIGMLVPLPIQEAMVVALSDETHVREQAARYVARRKILRSALSEVGFITEFSDAGLYIWCTRNETDWESVTWLAERGILATPGNFYGNAGARHIRIALTADDNKIQEAANRIVQ